MAFWKPGLKNGARRREFYEDRNARISILAQRLTLKPDTLKQTELFSAVSIKPLADGAGHTFFKRQLQMQQEPGNGRTPHSDPERGYLLPQFGDRQIGCFRNEGPHFVLLLSQGIVLMAAEFSRPAVACCIHPLHQLDHATRADIEHARHFAPGLSGKNRPYHAFP